MSAKTLTTNKVTQTFKQLFADRQKAYNNLEPAAALFYYDNNHNKGLRVEAPSIIREFISNVSFGRDPEGTIFFDSITDLNNDPNDSTDITYYNVFCNSVSDAEDQAVVVQFYQTNDDKDEVFAEFVAKDPTSSAQYLWTKLKGTWNFLNTGSSTAHVVKKANLSTATLVISPIGKKCTFDISNSKGTAIDAWGNVIFKDYDNLKSGNTSVINYNNDRILLYPENGSTAMTAVFIPIETSAADITALGGFNFVTKDAVGKWSDT